ncbi:MBG domain-containing protein, partial [Prevotella sp. P6B4]|uniref:MBG domain-containing protein n=1 Tax=Prevotella sp. P6B4 TaxID=1410614 RepID=UPI00048B455D
MKKTIKIFTLIVALFITSTVWADTQKIIEGSVNGGSLSFYTDANCNSVINNLAAVTVGSTVYIKATPASGKCMGAADANNKVGFIKVEKTISSDVAQSRTRGETLGDFIDVFVVNEASKVYSFTMPNDGKINVQVTAEFPNTQITISGWTYGDTANAPVFSPGTNDEGGVYEYKVQGAADDTYRATIPTNTGNYTIRVTFGIYSTTADFSIAKRTVNNPTIELAIPTEGCIYDGTAKEPAVTVKDGGTTIPSTEYSVSYSNNINVGTATVTITDMEGGNYTVSGSTTFAISSADGSLTPPAGKSDLVYNGTAQDLITAGSTTTGTMQYSLDGTTYSTTIPQGINAGSYIVYYKVKGDANHNDIAAQHFTVIIAAKMVDTPTITLSQTSYTYDGTVKEPTVTVKDGETTIPASEYSVSYTNNTNAGTATVTITDKEGGNYAVSGSTTFAISYAISNMAPPTGKSDLVYTGTAQDLITAGRTTTGTMLYSLDGTNYSTQIPQGTNAGSYTIYYRVNGDANHYDVAGLPFTVIIAAKTVDTPTITLSQINYTYDGTAKEPTVTVKDGETTIPASEYSVSYTNNINVGTATVTITDVDGGNYAVSGSTTFAISSADGSLTPPAGKSNLVYNGAAQDLITAGSTTTGTMQYSLDGTN